MTRLLLENDYRKEIEDIHDIQRQLLECIEDQGNTIDRIEVNMENTQAYMGNAVSNLKEANTYFVMYTPIIAGGIIGASIGLPFIAPLGVKLASIIAVSSGALGSLTGYKIQKID